jgi:hypothetical protein
MQIIANKTGTTLKLTKTEEKKLADAVQLFAAIWKHSDGDMADAAEDACSRGQQVLDELAGKAELATK